MTTLEKKGTVLFLAFLALLLVFFAISIALLFTGC
jgi:hypothetical protein